MINQRKMRKTLMHATHPLSTSHWGANTLDTHILLSYCKKRDYSRLQKLVILQWQKDCASELRLTPEASWFFVVVVKNKAS